MTIDEWIEYAEKRQKDHEYHSRSCRDDKSWVKHQKEWANEYRQLAEWLKELKAYREFADWLVKAVLEEDWGYRSDFYAEVLCRKLTKLGKLKVVDNKYVEVNADDD